MKKRRCSSILFFFSSRRRHTRYWRDWSSDVCSSDLEVVKKDPWELVTEAIAQMKRNGDVMRADRLKQVMQQIDSSFDEKNLGMSKFSRFVTEAAHRGLLTLTKLENGQFEIAPPDAGVARGLPAGQESTQATVPRLAGSAEGETVERPRRGRRGGRGRDRDVRGQRSAAAAPQPSPTETESSPQPEAAQVAASATPAAAAASADGIGSSGIRLRREEAFDLVRRAVGANGDAPVRASQVRTSARQLLG